MLDEHPRLASLAGAERLVRLSVPTYEWMRDTALARTTAPPSAAAAEQLRQAELLDPGSSGLPQLETHWLQLLRRALNSPVRLDMVSVEGTRAWTTTVHVAGQMLLALDQVREVSRDTGSLELGRRSSALTLVVGRIQQLSEFVSGLAPQRPAFGAQPTGPAPTTLIDAPSVAQVQIMVSSMDAARPATRERSWYALGEEGAQLAALEGEDDQLRLEPVPAERFSEFLRADLIAAIQQVAGAHDAAPDDTARTGPAGPQDGRADSDEAAR